MSSRRMPKTCWNYTLETETDRVIQAAAHTFNRFYQKFNFLVLPYSTSHPQSVFLPDLNWQKQPGLIKKLSRLSPSEQIPVTDSPSLIQPVKKELSRFNWSVEPEKTTILKKEWKSKGEQFWIEAFNIFPYLKNKQIQVEIRPTSFGTVATFNHDYSTTKAWTVKLYLRLNQSPSKIAWAILASFFWQPLIDQDYLWPEREAIIDSFFLFTKLGKIFPRFSSTLLATKRKESSQLVLDSHAYLKKLSLTSKPIFGLRHNQILLSGKKAFVGLTNQEKNLLVFLVKNKNQLCSFDQLAEALWPQKSYERFSPWAISKLVERLRKKFVAQGLSPALIQTQRGQGYLLRD